MERVLLYNHIMIFLFPSLADISLFNKLRFILFYYLFYCRNENRMPF